MVCVCVYVCVCGCMCIFDVMHLVQMETEMIDKLDVFISGGMGDAKYRHQLHVM